MVNRKTFLQLLFKTITPNLEATNDLLKIGFTLPEVKDNGETELIAHSDATELK